MTSDAIERALDRLRPYLNRDGSDVEFLGIADKRARLRLIGSCATRANARSALFYGVESFLKEQVAGLEGITVVGIDEEPVPGGEVRG
jgi:Fe-S cluster biogenesis protein NfuA